ncbi:hypothetical protein TIFTF001_038325 [Ficus carica]|uniref:Uncharacterized protein n=1 Tax=Ficus carica TaxID=3494 RepID=A0AA88J9U3_FICCA|nr:hypothetical protein TIFTF001_038325 [Ficus carica]
MCHLTRQTTPRTQPGRGSQQLPDDQNMPALNENVRPGEEHDHFHISNTQSIPELSVHPSRALVTRLEPTIGPFSDNMVTRPGFTTSSRCTAYPSWIVLGEGAAPSNTLPWGVIPVTIRSPLELHSTYYLTSDTSPVTVHINSRFLPPTTAQHHIATCLDCGYSCWRRRQATLVSPVPNQGHVVSVHWTNSPCKPKAYSPTGSSRQPTRLGHSCAPNCERHL